MSDRLFKIYLILRFALIFIRGLIYSIFIAPFAHFIIPNTIESLSNKEIHRLARNRDRDAIAIYWYKETSFPRSFRSFKGMFFIIFLF